MEQQSLDIILTKIVNDIDNANIPSIDKVDLLVNLKLLLEDKDRYVESIKVLQKHMPRKKRF
jgi:hypothetical protein